jgi:hypothetical protein
MSEDATPGLLPGDSRKFDAALREQGVGGVDVGDPKRSADEAPGQTLAFLVAAV